MQTLCAYFVMNRYWFLFVWSWICRMPHILFTYNKKSIGFNFSSFFCPFAISFSLKYWYCYYYYNMSFTNFSFACILNGIQLLYPLMKRLKRKYSEKMWMQGIGTIRWINLLCAFFRFSSSFIRFLLQILFCGVYCVLGSVLPLFGKRFDWKSARHRICFFSVSGWISSSTHSTHRLVHYLYGSGSSNTFRFMSTCLNRLRAYYL